MVYHAPFLCSAQLSRLVPENTRSYPPIYSSHSIQISYHVHKCKALKAGLHIRRKKLRLPDAFVRNANNAVVRGGGLRSPTYQLNLSRSRPEPLLGTETRKTPSVSHKRILQQVPTLR
jgi:hypothetical protein